MAVSLFGLEIRRTKKASAPLQPVNSSRGGWWPLLGVIRESYAGAWQQNVEVTIENVLAHEAVYACITLISSDIGKLRVKLVAQDANGIWKETTNAAHSPVLRKPNRYQTRIKFYEYWIVSKLIHGNTYILKQRDTSGIVRAMYILDPTRVTPLMAPDGSVYYELKRDYLSNLPDDSVVVPQSEIIHDVMIPLFHPLVGVSPIYACGVSALQGIKIRAASTKFFANMAVPSGILTAPGHIAQENADEMKARWEESFSGENVGRVAVLGDGLTYDKMAVSATDSQLIDQLKWTAEAACIAFHVPPWMIGLGAFPANANPEVLMVQYYSQCLQNLIECIELLLDEGLAAPGQILMPKNDAGQQLGTEMDLDDLMRMDTATKVKASSDAIKGGGMSPNEARLRYLDLGPVAGGASPYLQMQNFSLEALAKRDAKADPFATAGPKPTAPKPEDAKDEDEDADAEDADAEKDEDDEPVEDSERAAMWERGLASVRTP